MTTVFSVVYPEGVEVHPGTTIAKATCEGGKVKVTTGDGKEVCCHGNVQSNECLSDALTFH